MRLIAVAGVIALAAVSWLESIPAAVAWSYAAQAGSKPPEQRVVYLTRASAWDANPKYKYRLAAALFSISEVKGGDEKRAALMEALNHVSQAHRADPLNPNFRRLMGGILWRLNRKEDASAIFR